MHLDPGREVCFVFRVVLEGGQIQARLLRRAVMTIGAMFFDERLCLGEY